MALTPSMAASAALALLLAGAAASPSQRPRNWIFVLADDMGVGDVGFDSSAEHHPGAGGVQWVRNSPRTPNLDAMASSPHAITFRQFYSGSPVCSPTRSAMLTGRTPDRECIVTAEGCGQKPAWACPDPMPFPPTVFTIAEAAKSIGMSTIHIGKWHLGNFFPKARTPKDFVNDKWPVSHPGMHGFDEWHSTEASAASSMCNCGCKPEWVQEGDGCVIGDGIFQHGSYPCTNYWFPTDTNDVRAECHEAKTSTLDCVGNLTSKIPGDDSAYIMDVFEEYMARQVKAGTPFLAQLWLHTVHVPHPAMPEWYHAYEDVFGKPAGDYLGTISQMDAQIGRLRDMLHKYGIADDTILFFTADNGPFVDTDRAVHASTLGLRQCKGSAFEGGIRVPGIVEWPGGIAENRVEATPAHVNDYLPTFLDWMGITHPNPDWPVDGESLAALIGTTAPFNRSSPLAFRFNGQVAYITPDGRHKLLKKPTRGLCALEENTYMKKSHNGLFLFDLVADPTESYPLNDEQPDLYEALVAKMEAFEESITQSQVHESECRKSAEEPLDVHVSDGSETWLGDEGSWATYV